MPITGQTLIRLAVLCSLLIATQGYAIERTYSGPFIENDDLLMVLVPRTPEQMIAFYEARGFPKTALQRLRKLCFITVHIENKSQQVIWLETVNWDFTVAGEHIEQISRQQWNSWWDDINLTDSNRSTFGWTQLPAVRDLQPDEPVGGNIILDGKVKNLDLQARFLTGQDKRGGMLDFQFRNIKCPHEEARP